MIDDSFHPADRFFVATGNLIALPREKGIEKCAVNKYYRHGPKLTTESRTSHSSGNLPLFFYPVYFF
jgi:hypothetical protein